MKEEEEALRVSQSASALVFNFLFLRTVKRAADISGSETAAF